MTIVYAAVARGGASAESMHSRASAQPGLAAPLILVEYQKPDKSPRSLDVREILGKVPTQFATRRTETTERYLFHILVEVHSIGSPSIQTGGLQMPMVYVCVTEPSFDKERAFQFLEHLKSIISGSSECLLQAKKANGDRALQPLLEAPLNKAVDQFSKDQSSDKVAQLRQQVSEVQQIMTQNVERVLERGDRLDELVDRSGDLEASASAFRTSARQVRKNMCWKNCKCNIMIAVAALIVIFVIVMISLWKTGHLGGSSNSGNGGGAKTTPHATSMP